MLLALTVVDRSCGNLVSAETILEQVITPPRPLALALQLLPRSGHRVSRSQVQNGFVVWMLLASAEAAQFSGYLVWTKLVTRPGVVPLSSHVSLKVVINLSVLRFRSTWGRGDAGVDSHGSVLRMSVLRLAGGDGSTVTILSFGLASRAGCEGITGAVLSFRPTSKVSTLSELFGGRVGVISLRGSISYALSDSI